MATATKARKPQSSSKGSSKSSPSKAPNKPAIKLSKLKPGKAAPARTREKGRFSGLGAQATWHKLFKDNEKAKLPDEKLLEAMFREFPAKKGAGIKDYTLAGCQAVRRWHNAGNFDGQQHSFVRYGADKKPLLRRANES
jgi:hypothetical protein